MRKAGIILNKFSDETIRQQLLFKDPNSPKENTEFMRYIDKMNAYETQVYFRLTKYKEMVAHETKYDFTKIYN